MRKIKFLIFGLLAGTVIFSFCFSSLAENEEAEAPPAAAQGAAQQTVVPAQEIKPEAVQVPGLKPEIEVVVNENLAASENVTLDFKDADIQNVLKIISYKSGVNIVSTPEVIGNVTIRLVDVPWQSALDMLLKSYGFAYEQQGNILLVTKAENIAKIQAEEPLKTEIITLKFLDAQDAQKILIPMLSPRGRISVLYTRGQKGWKFGTYKIGRQGGSGEAMAREEQDKPKTETISIAKNEAGGIVSQKAEFEGSIKSKTLVITDTAASLDRIRNVILPTIDKKPKQVLIETRIMEVNVDWLRDFGFDWGTGTAGASGYDTAPTALKLKRNGRYTLAGRNLSSEFTPTTFNPLEGTTTFPGTYPYKAGLEILFKKMTGAQFEVILHALEEDAHTNTLSAPRIVTLDNQEASILVGYHTPILSSTVTAGTTTEGPTTTQTLDYYQEIGIRLNVVPQVSEEGYINMILHPSVTSSSSSVTATNVAGIGSTKVTTTVDYPIIDVREAQTQVMMKDGETIVLGGLLKDVKSKETIGIPYLSKIPFLGRIFQREVTDTDKVDLLIFITGRILKEGEELTEEEIARLQEDNKSPSVEKGRIAVKTAEKKP